MNIEEARLYLEHTSKDDFNLEEWQKENRYQAIQVILREIERLNNIINELEKYINEKYIYDDIGMKIFDASTLQDKLQELKGSDKE